MLILAIINIMTAIFLLLVGMSMYAESRGTVNSSAGKAVLAMTVFFAVLLILNSMTI